MSYIYLPLPRAEVIRYLGPSWPPRAGTTQLRLAADAELTDGAVIVYPVPGEPGYAWWAVDGIVPSQDAGPVTQALADQVPGSVVELIPDPGEGAEPPPSRPYGATDIS